MDLCYPKLFQAVWTQRFQNSINKKVKAWFAAALLTRLCGNNVPGHTTRAPQAGFNLRNLRKRASGILTDVTRDGKVGLRYARIRFL